MAMGAVTGVVVGLEARGGAAWEIDDAEPSRKTMLEEEGERVSRSWLRLIRVKIPGEGAGVAAAAASIETGIVRGGASPARDSMVQQGRWQQRGGRRQGVVPTTHSARQWTKGLQNDQRNRAPPKRV